MDKVRQSELEPASDQRRQALAVGLSAIAGCVLYPRHAAADSNDGISHTAEAIHQQPLIAASRGRVYQALTDANQFERLTQFSAAAKTMSLKRDPARIDLRAGGAFALFGGYISGRIIELVADERIVQAWRPGNWDPGIYSIVRFQLVEQGGGTRIDFDHTGFPSGNAGHLAQGWQENYWEPLRKLLV